MDFADQHGDLTARAGGGRLSPGALTEIAVPHRQYPGGYSAIVVGGRIHSGPGSSTLRIRACRGAGKVRVRVKPAARRSRDSC